MMTRAFMTEKTLFDHWKSSGAITNTVQERTERSLVQIPNPVQFCRAKWIWILRETPRASLVNSICMHDKWAFFFQMDEQKRVSQSKTRVLVMCVSPRAGTHSENNPIACLIYATHAFLIKLFIIRNSFFCQAHIPVQATRFKRFGTVVEIQHNEFIVATVESCLKKSFQLQTNTVVSVYHRSSFF